MEKSPTFLAATVLIGTLLLVVFGISSIPPINAPLPSEVANSAGTDTPLDNPTVDFGNPSRGAKNAKVTIVEFGDYLCSACVGFEDTAARILQEYPNDVRLVWKDFPASSLRNDALTAAIAARCAGYQGAFWEYHDLLFANQASINSTAFPIFATQLGLDQAEFEQCLNDRTPMPLVQRDSDEGLRLRINGTPYLFVNDRRISGALDHDLLVKVITSEISKAAAAAAEPAANGAPAEQPKPAPAP